MCRNLSRRASGGSEIMKIWYICTEGDTVATYRKPGLVAFSFHFLRSGLDHEARARVAGFSSTHPQFCGVCLCLVSGDHQLLVWGHQEGGKTLLHGTSSESEAVVLHPLQQLQHQWQPAGPVHLWDRRGKVPLAEVSHWNLFLLWTGRRHER